MWTLIDGGRVELEQALVRELFRPTAEKSPLAESLLRRLARSGSLALVAPLPKPAEPAPVLNSSAGSS